MGVPQAIEIQNQSSTDFKYFHLNEDSEVDIGGDGPKEMGGVGMMPKLSVWGWFTPSQYHYKKGLQDSSTTIGEVDMHSLKHKSIGFHSHQPFLQSDGGSDTEDNGKDFKIDIHPSSDSMMMEEDTEYAKVYNGANLSTNNKGPIMYPYSPVYSDIAFSVLVGVVCLFSIIYSLLVGPLAIFFAFAVSIIILVSYISTSFAKNNKWYLYSITVLSVGLGLTIPSFFQATGAVVLGTNRLTWDRELASADSSLLGWIFPLGQMGLFIDKSSFIGPYSFIGELSTEIFQLSYISYYIWGYFMEVWILFNLWKCYLSKDAAQMRMMPIWDQRLKMFICSWISTYFVVFSINLIFPAVSPRVFLNDQYENKLTGFGFAGFVRDKIENAAKGSFGSFPSGHIATSWAISFASYPISRTYAFVSGVAAFLITIATMYLRYHYFVDFLAAIPVIIICLLFGGFYSVSSIKQSLLNLFVSIKKFFKTTIAKFNKSM
ncbi:hypothetical protein CYY_000361 [Polysphondylium violaceum]|uniref:Inositolphosphotransferase Aur1/Ipt1 domain-containing protein n=1 Tax=Polysphondylium violaceum TaxID=133409 RepID=A0A8J4Q003_9MYCE|nr:hypothetical protein CYY_000361 [Polysphondylium violaceum]